VLSKITPFTLNCRDKSLDLSTVAIMAILNCTPDSFYDGGQELSQDEIADKVGAMTEAGAVIIDIGGMSSRPGANLISADEEWARIHKAVEIVLRHFPDQICCVDTLHAETARRAAELGVQMINNISGTGNDQSMLSVISEYNLAYVLMHMRGTPNTMQDHIEYDNVVQQVYQALKQSVELCLQENIQNIVVDPGFGFGKSLEQNYQLLASLSSFATLGFPILVGLSRKSMIYKQLGIGPEDALNGTSALHAYSIMNGASILRVHDVKEAVEVARLLQILNSNWS